MPQTAIIHTATRVVRRLTLDVSPQVASDETALVLATPIDLAGGYWVLDTANPPNKIAATPAQIAAADVDPVQMATKKTNALAAYKNAIDSLIADNSIPNSVVQVFRALKAIL